MDRETSIDIFPWNTNFDTGVEVIDSQHRGLVELLNRLANYIAFSREPLDLGAFLDDLIAYSNHHFVTEEAIWEQHIPEGDSTLTRHREEHQALSETITRIKRGDEAATDVIEILALLVRWLTTHILESDRELANIVQAMQQGMPLSEAKLHCSHLAPHDNIIPLYDTLLVSTLHLIAELKTCQSHEEAFKRNEHHFRQIIENTSLGFAVMDREHRVQYASPAMTRLLQITPDQALDKPCHLLLTGDGLSESTDVGYRILAGGGEQALEFNDNDGRHFRLYATPYQNARGELGGYIEILEDISEKREAEQQMAQQLSELTTWQSVMLEREERVITLKQEVNDLLKSLGKPPRYGTP